MTIAFICVLVAGLLPYATLLPFARHIDQREPRQSALRLEGMTRRAHAAHLNHFEAFPLFAAAVIIAHLQAGQTFATDLLAIAFVIVRLVYTGAYLYGVQPARSALFAVGVLIDIAIMLTPSVL